MAYILEHNTTRNKNKWWIAPWTGDPGRTIIKEDAKRYSTLKGAKIAATRCRNKYKHIRTIDLVPIEVQATLTEVGQEFDKKFIEKDGLIVVKNKTVQIPKAVQTSVDTQRDEVLDAIDTSIPSEQKLNEYFE